MYNKDTRQPEKETARVAKRQPRRTHSAAGEKNDGRAYTNAAHSANAASITTNL